MQLQPQPMLCRPRTWLLLLCTWLVWLVAFSGLLALRNWCSSLAVGIVSHRLAEAGALPVSYKLRYAAGVHVQTCETGLQADMWCLIAQLLALALTIVGSYSAVAPSRATAIALGCTSVSTLYLAGCTTAKLMLEQGPVAGPPKTLALCSYVGGCLGLTLASLVVWRETKGTDRDACPSQLICCTSLFGPIDRDPAAAKEQRRSLLHGWDFTTLTFTRLDKFDRGLGVSARDGRPGSAGSAGSRLSPRRGPAGSKGARRGRQDSPGPPKSSRKGDLELGEPEVTYAWASDSETEHEGDL